MTVTAADKTGARTTEAADVITGARERIDALDDRIIGLIQERMAVSAVIQEARITSGGRRVNLSREMEVLDHYRHALGKPGTALAMTMLEPEPRARLSVEYGRRVRASHLSSGAFSPVRRVTCTRAASLSPVSVSARGRARKNHAWLTGAMRRTDRAARRGTSLQESDRTAGDSSPVTQENGRLRGRPGPADGAAAGSLGPLDRTPFGLHAIRSKRRNPRRRFPRHRRCPDAGAGRGRALRHACRGALRHVRAPLGGPE